MITRLYTGGDGQSHFEELDMDSGPFAWGELKSATGVMFRQSVRGAFSDWHTAPRRQFVITLTGEMEIGLVDGTLRRFRAGDVLLADDTSGQGHTTRDVGDVPRVTAYIPLE